MRAILKKATADLGLDMVQSPLPMLPVTPRTLSKLGQDHRLAFVDPHNKQYGSQVSVGSPHSDVGKETAPAMSSGLMDPTVAPIDMLEAYKAEKIQRNPMLASLLDASDKSSGSGAEPQQPSMLSALLGDQPPPPTKTKRPRKRRSMSDQRSPGSSAKSPKRRPLDDDVGSGSNLSSVEVSPSPSASGFEPSPSHSSSGVSTPVTSHTSLAQLIAEDSFPQVSPMTKLTTTVDSIMKQEPKTTPSVPLEGFGGTESAAQPVRVKEESNKPEDGPRKKLASGSCLAELLESPKCETLPNNMFFSKDRSNSTSDLSSSSSSVHSKSLNDNRPDKGSPFEFKPDPVLNDSSYSSKTKSEQLSSSSSYNHERSSSSSKSSSEKLNSSLWDSKSDLTSTKSEEKVKEKSKKEKKESSSDDKPHEREKITVKLNTKELTAKTSVKERSSSPHDIELTKSHSREGKSSKESSKSNREKMYDISSDNSLPASLVVTRPLLSEGGRSGSPSLKIKKIRTEDGKGEKKRKSSKHEGESSKRKRDESKKDKSSKKRKVYDSELSDRTGSDRYSAVEKGPTTIKITTKMQLQSSKLSSPIKSSKSLSSSNPSGLKSIKADRLSMSPQGSKSKSSIKTLNRSKSESQALSIGRNYDSKLNKTPTIKLKPLVMPNSATSINISSKGSSSPGSAPSKSSSDLKSKLAANPKSRKPLDAIVDKLKTKQGTTPGSVLQFSKPRDGGEKKDALTKRNEVDEVRKAIIQQGIRPTGATKELTSYRAGPSMRPTKLSIDSNKRSEMKGSGTPTNPIPKLSQNMNKSSPASSSSKLGTIPKTSNSSSNGSNNDYSSSKSNSVSNYGSSSSSSSGGSSSDYSSRDSSRVSGQSSEGSRIKMSNSSSNSHGPSHGPSENTSRTENSDNKRESKDISSASSAMYSSATVSLSHGNSTTSTSMSSTSTGNSNSASSYTASPSNASAPSSSSSSYPSSSNPSLGSSTSSVSSAPSASSSSSSAPATNMSASNNSGSSKDSGSGKDQAKDSDKNRKRSVDDISERLLTRHFLDAVTKMEDGGEEEKKGSSKSSSDSRTDFTELPDKVRPNGYNKNDRLNDSWSGKEDSREGRSAEGSSDFSSGSRSNCVDNPASRTERRSHPSLEDKENSVGRDEDSVFRAPTPKGSKSGVEVTEDRLEPRARSDSRTKPVLSPRSDVSSPEDGLVIDCPGSPKSVRSPSNNRTDKTVSKPTTPINCSDSASSLHKNSSSSAVSRNTPQSPSPHKMKASSPSTTKSPAIIPHSPIRSPGSSSQVDDDELMDVALIL